MARLPVDVMDMGNRGELPNAFPDQRMASGEDFGAGAGRALQGFANSVGRLGSHFANEAEKLKAKLEANKEQSDAFNRDAQFIKLQEDIGTEYGEKLRGIAGSADGWWEGSRKATQERLDKWLETVPEEKRGEYQLKSVAFLKGFTAQAFQDQYGQQDKHTRNVIDEASRRAGLQVQQNPDSYAAVLAQQEALVDKSTLPPEAKAEIKSALKSNLAYTSEMSRAQSNPRDYATGSAAVASPAYEAEKSKDGYWTAPNVSYALDGKIRSKPVSKKYVETISSVVAQIDPKLEVRIVSGGQDTHGPSRTGSRRHDINPATGEGETSDLVLYRNGKMLAPGAHKELYATLFNRAAAAGFTGMGHYSWGVHIGGGAKAAWGPNRSSSTLDPFFGDAVQKGWAKQKTPAAKAETNISVADPDSPAAQLTPAQAAAVKEMARLQLEKVHNDEEQAAKAQQAVQLSDLYVTLKEGAAPETAYSNARQSGLLSDYDDINRAETIIRERYKAKEDASVGQQLMGGGPVAANPFDPGHRKGVDAYYTTAVKTGAPPEQIAADVFDKTGIVPTPFYTAVRGAMISQEPEQLGAALVTASNMLKKNPNAFAGRDGANQIEDKVLEYNRLVNDLGYSTDQAAQRIIANAQETARNPVKKEQADAFKKDALTQDKIEARVKYLFSSSNPFSDLPYGAQIPAGPPRAAINSIYSGFVEEGYRKFSDPDKATAYADAEFNKQFGVQNGVVTRYPPNKANLPSLKLPDASDGYSWINEQAAKHVKEATGAVVDPSQIVLVPVERKGHSTRAAFMGAPETVTRGDNSKFNSVPYMIVVLPKDETQDPLPVNGVFFPDVEEYVDGKNKAIDQEKRPAGLAGRYWVPKPQLKTANQVSQELEAKVKADQELARAEAKESDAEFFRLYEKAPNEDPMVHALRTRLRSGDDDPKIVELFKRREKLGLF